MRGNVLASFHPWRPSSHFSPQRRPTMCHQTSPSQRSRGTLHNRTLFATWSCFDVTSKGRHITLLRIQHPPRSSKPVRMGFQPSLVLLKLLSLQQRPRHQCVPWISKTRSTSTHPKFLSARALQSRQARVCHSETLLGDRAVFLRRASSTAVHVPINKSSCFWLSIDLDLFNSITRGYV